MECKFIKVAQPLEWKVHYGSYYFKANLKKEKVFIKVTSVYTKDGYENEVVCDDYIKKNSAFLAERTPKILKNFVYEDFHIIIFECFEIQKELGKEDLQNAVSEFLEEYTEKGIIHQDLKPTNLTIHNEKYCIIDYGFSICPDSNHIRITTANYIEYISDEAKNILSCADFYYDDAIACGITNVDRSLINFIVGSRDKYFIKLAGNVYEYRLERLEGRRVCLLHKVDCGK